VGHGDLPRTAQDYEPSIIRFIHQIIMYVESGDRSEKNFHLKDFQRDMSGFLKVYMTMHS
jgi:hypothetical protein